MLAVIKNKKFIFWIILSFVFGFCLDVLFFPDAYSSSPATKTPFFEIFMPLFSFIFIWVFLFLVSSKKTVIYWYSIGTSVVITIIIMALYDYLFMRGSDAMFFLIYPIAAAIASLYGFWLGFLVKKF